LRPKLLERRRGLRGDSIATWNAENIKRVFKNEHADAAKSAVVLGGGGGSVRGGDEKGSGGERERWQCVCARARLCIF
jgi:hypothetical protein